MVPCVLTFGGKLCPCVEAGGHGLALFFLGLELFTWGQGRGDGWDERGICYRLAYKLYIVNNILANFLEVRG